MSRTHVFLSVPLSEAQLERLARVSIPPSAPDTAHLVARHADEEACVIRYEELSLNLSDLRLLRDMAREIVGAGT